MIPSPSGPVATEVRSRGRITAPVVFFLYAGVPLLFGAATYAIDRAEPSGSGRLLYIVPGATLALTLLCYRWQWCRPARWPGAGKWVTGFCAVWVTLHATVLGWAEVTPAALAAIPAGLTAGLLGWLVGRWASRKVLLPPAAELGDGPYHLRYPLRGATDCSIQIGGSDVGVQRTTRSWSLSGSSNTTSGPSYKLPEVHSIRVVQLDGTEQVLLPVLIVRAAPQQATAGPALAFSVKPRPEIELSEFTKQFLQDSVPEPAEWVLPLDDADVIAQILLRRQSRAV